MSECYIVGGGPSLKGFDWNLLSDKYVIAVNRSYEVLPNARIVYFTDLDWYEEHKQGLNSHRGCLINGSNSVSQHIPNVIQYTLTQQYGLVMEDKCLAHGHNSVYAAINLAVQMKFNKIYLLGVDMKWSGDDTHWHDGHTRTDPEHAYKMMLTAFDTIVDPLKELNVEVINVNDINKTALKAFPIKSFEEVFGCLNL